MRALAALLLLSALLAGCSGGSGDGGARLADAPAPLPAAPPVAPAPNATAELPPATLELSGCLQLHTFFPFPIAAFQQLGFGLPEGFQFATSNGATVDAFLAWWFCPEGVLNNTVNGPFADVGSMLAALPVVPPADLAGRDPRGGEVQLDLVPLTWILSEQLAGDFLARIDGLRGGYVQSGDVRLTGHHALGGEAHSATAPASFGTFDVDTAIQPAPADNPAGRYRLWLSPGEGPVSSYLDIANSAGRTLGSGAAALRFAGDPDTGAPPATAGLSHVVDSTAVAVALVGLP